MTLRSTHRWYGVAAVAFLAAAAGVLASRSGLLLVGVVGVGFAAYARLTAVPAVDLVIERSVSDAEPVPGQEIGITLRIRNAGDHLPDLRVVDGVPGGLDIADGSPRIGTALRRGKTVEFSYTVEAVRGRHGFDPVTVIARDASGAAERELELSTATTITCIPRLPPNAHSVPLRPQTAQYTGPVPTASGGAGVEFYATREYRPGDAMTRVDWSRLARTGELSTIDYRQERMATVVLVIDARQVAYQSDPKGTPAIEHSLAAGRAMVTALLDDGHQVGLAAIGRDPCWVAPAIGADHRATLRRSLAVHPALEPTPPEDQVVVARRIRELRRHLPANAQVFLVTPLVDDYIATIAGRLDAYGHAASVLSPDVTGTASAGQRLAKTERDLRIKGLMETDIPVIDWPTDEPLERTLEGQGERG